MTIPVGDFGKGHPVWANWNMAMIRELLTLTKQAAVVLDIDSDFVGEIEESLQRLFPYQVGTKGNMQEWYFDWEDADPRHRHVSHLFGLHPGRQITPEESPILAAACRRSIRKAVQHSF